MPENFLSEHDTPSFDEFYTRFYPKLVEWLVQHGMRREEAVETTQDICLAMHQSWGRITDAVGWGYNGARWKLLDRQRKIVAARELPMIVKNADGDEMETEYPSNDPDIALVIDARERIDRHWEPFLEMFELRAEGYNRVVRAVTVLVQKRAPGDQVTQFLEAYQLVFTGVGADKRDRSDVHELAQILNMTAGALRTAFSRLQPVWYECARETYLRAV